MNKISRLLLLCSTLVSTANADDTHSNFDSKGLTALTDFDARATNILTTAATNNKFDESLILINQAGVGAFAYVDQSNGAGNFVAINQDARVHGASAVVFQVGSNNRAVINQH